MAVKLADLRFGHAPLPDPTPGNEPRTDALALFVPGMPSPAERPIPGRQTLESLGKGHRYVVRVPDDWNGDLAVCGTPATRGEFANDLILGDFLLARGYAFASSNKGIPFNGILESAGETPDPTTAYPIPFEVHGLRAMGMVVRFGALWPRRVPVREWHDDLAALVRVAHEHVEAFTGRMPRRIYALGLSMGGSQVRYLLERSPDLVDGGLEWCSPFWSRDLNLLTYLPPFLRRMPDYVRSDFTDRDAHDAIVALGFPPDLRQTNPQHPSLWNDHYANLPPYYADLTTYAFARLLDPETNALCGNPPNVRNPVTGAQQPGPTNARGIALPEERMSYVPSQAARDEVAAIAQTGEIERPLIGLAAASDAFIPPKLNFEPYMDSVRKAGRAHLYAQYLIEGATHVDSYNAFGYGLRPMLPFVWKAFDRLVQAVEEGEPLSGAGTSRAIGDVDEM